MKPGKGLEAGPGEDADDGGVGEKIVVAHLKPSGLRPIVHPT